MEGRQKSLLVLEQFTVVLCAKEVSFVGNIYSSVLAAVLLLKEKHSKNIYPFLHF